MVTRIYGTFPQTIHSERKSGIRVAFEKVREVAERIFYALRHPTYACAGIEIGNAVRPDNSPRELGHFATTNGYAIFADTLESCGLGKIDWTAEPRFLAFHLATMHGRERHNVTVMVDKTTMYAYVIDGKGNRPDSAYLTNQPGNARSTTTVENFLEKLPTTTTLFLSHAWQRSMDCTILPQVLMPALIEKIGNKAETPDEARATFNETMKGVASSRLKFYDDINRLRDLIFNARVTHKPSVKPDDWTEMRFSGH